MQTSHFRHIVFSFLFLIFFISQLISREAGVRAVVVVVEAAPPIQSHLGFSGHCDSFFTSPLINPSRNSTPRVNHV